MKPGNKQPRATHSLARLEVHSVKCPTKVPASASMTVCTIPAAPLASVLMHIWTTLAIVMQGMNRSLMKAVVRNYAATSMTVALRSVVLEHVRIYSKTTSATVLQGTRKSKDLKRKHAKGLCVVLHQPLQMLLPFL